MESGGLGEEEPENYRQYNGCNEKLLFSLFCLPHFFYDSLLDLSTPTQVEIVIRIPYEELLFHCE